MLELREEELLSKHRKERKNLQAQVQSLKKGCAKGDKKKKKEITDTIAKLEQELQDKQSKELDELKNLNLDQAEIAENCENNKCNEINEEQEPEVKENKDIRVSKAQKRRNKKAAEDKEREERIRQQEEENKNGPRLLENEKIDELLKDLGLKIHTVPADGDCLYCSIKHQLTVTNRNDLSVTELRKLTSEYMKTHKDDILPFMSHTNDDEVFTEQQYEEYCNKVASSSEWGGQVELLALSNTLKCPIKVIQASSSPTLQGEQFEGPPLTLTFHRHLYGLGEHYNSTVTI